MSRIQVHIDRLVLPEMGMADRSAFIEGLRAELAHALADPAVRAACAQARRTPLLRLAGGVLTPGRSGAAQFGGILGRAIGKRLKP